MTIVYTHFPCWGCGKHLKANTAHAGKKCKCPACARVNNITTDTVKNITIPASEEEPITLYASRKKAPLHTYVLFLILLTLAVLFGPGLLSPLWTGDMSQSPIAGLVDLIKGK